MIRARSRSVKHRSSRSFDVVFTPRSSTPWLRTSRKPKSKNVATALATSGVSWFAWLTCVWTAIETPRSRAFAPMRSMPRLHVRLQEVLRQPHQALRGQPDVADVLDVQQRQDELLEVLDRQVRHVAAGDDHVAHRRRPAQVLEHLAVAVLALRLELVLRDLRRGVADQVHARAVPAVLRARRQHLGQDLRRVPVGEPLDGPHVGLVQAVALRVRVRRPLGVALAERRRHVAADRVGAKLALVHRVDHLRRDQHRHRRPLEHVALDVGRQVVGQVVAERRLQLLEVLHGVGALPLRALPLLCGDVPVARKARPVGLGQLALQRVPERLLGGVGAASRGGPGRSVRALRAGRGRRRERLPGNGDVLLGEAVSDVCGRLARAHVVGSSVEVSAEQAQELLHQATRPEFLRQRHRVPEFFRR